VEARRTPAGAGRTRVAVPAVVRSLEVVGSRVAVLEVVRSLAFPEVVRSLAFPEVVRSLAFPEVVRSLAADSRRDWGCRPKDRWG
jgi:hypothetical protein